MVTLPSQAALPDSAAAQPPIPIEACRRPAGEEVMYLVGRSHEQRAINELLRTLRTGSSPVLVLRGETGTGKSALLEYAARSAGTPLRVAMVVAVEFEAELEFASLHQLVRPFLAQLPQLPAPQQRALAAAFGELDGPAPDRFMVCLAVLTLLAEAANEAPLLCIVDDAQWLDQASAEVLAFVARRVEADRLALLFAVREPSDRSAPLVGLPSLTLQDLDLAGSRRLPASLRAGTTDSGVEHQVAVHAAEPFGHADLTHRTERDQMGGVTPAQYALTVLELSECNYSAALALARPILDDNGPAFGVVVLPEVIEAAVHTGDHELALRALGRLAERARAGDDDLAQGLLARCRALVASGEQGDALFSEALERMHRYGLASETARTHLLYGEWLRRRRRRADARTQLRIAHEMFVHMGARGFASRAWSELAATGEKARRRDGSSATALTVRETQIAQLVMDGATNAEVGAQLFISPSTVEYHLRNMFQKVGVPSRAKLVAALRVQEGAA